MVGPLRSGFPPLASVLLRKTRPANGLWAKPGNSQGILATLRCSCSLRTAGARSGGRRPHSAPVLVQPAKPKGRFTMAQRYVQYGVGLRSLSFATQYGNAKCPISRRAQKIVKIGWLKHDKSNEKSRIRKPIKVDHTNCYYSRVVFMHIPKLEQHSKEKYGGQFEVYSKDNKDIYSFGLIE
jgi:hypothetical protein